MSGLSVAHLRKSFGGVKAIDDLTFEVLTGSIFGIIGPNGAGKTTLFNCLTGFLKPAGGSVRLDGNEVLGKKPYQLVDIGMARSFQLVKPFYGMTALETLFVSLNSRRMRARIPSSDEGYRRSSELLERIGLSGKSDVLVDDLTQGELRLLDVARALATQPDFLFLDEPFSGLGHDQVDALSSIILELRRSGMTVVMIEHRLRELMRLVDRVMVINFGGKIAEGSPAEVVADPDVIEAYLGKKGSGLGLTQR